MAKISSFIAQEGIDKDENLIFRPAQPVNIKFLKENDFYRHIIVNIIRMMDIVLTSKFEDHYTEMKGISAPTIGFPFKIIAFVNPTTKKTQFCINPEITNYAESKIEVRSSSAIFPNKYVQIMRYKEIDLKYFDLTGEICLKYKIDKNEGGFIIQHEIDLVEGITILDRKNSQSSQN
jgi:peptide deformylase